MSNEDRLAPVVPGTSTKGDTAFRPCRIEHDYDYEHEHEYVNVYEN
jgi:hypothetical protein